MNEGNVHFSSLPHNDGKIVLGIFLSKQGNLVHEMNNVGVVDHMHHVVAMKTVEMSLFYAYMNIPIENDEDFEESKCFDKNL